MPSFDDVITLEENVDIDDNTANFYITKDNTVNKYRFCALTTPLSSTKMIQGDPTSRIKEYWPISRKELNASNLPLLFPAPKNKIRTELLSFDEVQQCFNLNIEEIPTKLCGEDIVAGYSISNLASALYGDNISIQRVAIKKISELSQNEIISSHLSVEPLLTALASNDFYIRKYAALIMAKIVAPHQSYNVLSDHIKLASPDSLLINLLNNPESDDVTKQFAINALYGLTLSRCYINGVYGILPLVAILDDPKSSDTTKQCSAKILANLAESRPNATIIRDADGISKFIALLKNPKSSETTKQYSAKTLCELAHPDKETLDTNLVEPFIALLNHPDSSDRTKEHAARGLLRLIFYDNSTNLNAIREENGILTLIALLNTTESSYETKGRALVTLEVLARNTNNQNAIREANGIPSIIAILNGNITSNIPPKYAGIPSIIQQHAAAALMALSDQNASNQDAIREANGIVSLLAYFNNFKNANAATVLAAIACNNDTNQNAIREANGITSLVAYLIDPTVGVGDSMSGDHAISRVIAALRVLASNNENKNTIREEHGIKALISVLAKPIREGRTFIFKRKEYYMENAIAEAAITLRTLAENDAVSQNVIREENGIAVLINILNLKVVSDRPIGSTSWSKLQVLSALITLSANAENKKQMQDINFNDELQPFLNSSSASDKTKDEANKILNYLTQINQIASSVTTAPHASFHSQPSLQGKDDNDTKNCLKKI